MAAALTTAARLLTRHAHVEAPAIAGIGSGIRTSPACRPRCSAAYAPATAAKILVAVRRVLAESRKLRLISHEDFLGATELARSGSGAAACRPRHLLGRAWGDVQDDRGPAVADPLLYRASDAAGGSFALSPIGSSTLPVRV